MTWKVMTHSLYPISDTNLLFQQSHRYDIYIQITSHQHLLCRTVTQVLLPYQLDLEKYNFQSQTNPNHMSQTNPLHRLETNPRSAGSVWALERWTVVSLSGQFYLPASTTCYQTHLPAPPPHPTIKYHVTNIDKNRDTNIIALYITNMEEYWNFLVFSSPHITGLS